MPGPVTTGDWSRTWSLLQQLRELPAEQRLTVLAECGAEPHIVSEVLAMLEAGEPDPDHPAAGRRYGRYTLVAPLGSGGMGEVFSARDAELDRMVAIKFVGARARLLPASMDRLVGEARAASALNHPNLVTVHEVLRFEFGVALVTELVQGQSLRVFCGVPRPVAQVAAWGAQIARALAAAHAGSIVHSDIKPENIMLRNDGYIKILDFGLARSVGVEAELDSQPLGTLGYVSPEQILGQVVTGASDVFSLGVTLLELATGQNPFQEGTARATTTAIRERPVSFQAPAIPGGKSFARLLLAMLDKDPARRPGMHEVAAVLDRVAVRSSRSRTGVVLRIAGVAALLLAAGVLLYRWKDRPAPLLHFSAPEAITRYSGVEEQASFSPDGRHIIFVWSGPDAEQEDLYIRRLEAGDQMPLRVTNDVRREASPLWSPDGRHIAWQRRALGGEDTDILVAPWTGSAVGPARVIGHVADHEGYFGLAWWPDSGSLVMRDRSPSTYPLVRVFVADGRKIEVTHQPDVTDFRPALSHDRRRMLFLRSRRGNTKICAIGVTDPLAAAARCVDVPNSVQSAAWAPDSRQVLYADAEGLWQLDFDAEPPRPARRLMDGALAGLMADFSGTRFAFNRTITDSNIWRLDVTTRKAAQLLGSSAEDSEPAFSPDGRKILFRSNRTGAFELYLSERDGSRLRQITQLGGHIGSGRWSPDGRWIAFDAERQTPQPDGRTRFDNVYVMPSGGGPIRRLTDDECDNIVPGWSADSRWIYFSRGTRRESWKIPLQGGKAVKVGDGEIWDPMESPDGRWLLFERPSSEVGIWRRPVAGGPETRVPGTEDLRYRTWEVNRSGLSFLRLGPHPGFIRTDWTADSAAHAQFVGPAPRRLLRGPRMMTVSPDGKTILYTSEDLTIGDIFLIEARPNESDH